MKIIKITRWGISKLECIKAVKELMGLTLRGAKDLVENSEMPCTLEVHDSEKLKTFTNYTQESCSGMKYTVEDVTISRTELVENFANAINNVREAFSALISQNDEIGDRYNKVCAEANLLQAEVEKLKANNNNDLCIQLREEIACLKRDNGVLKESNNTFVETIKDQEKQIRDLELENKSLKEDVQRLNEILQAIRNLTF